MLNIIYRCSFSCGLFGSNRYRGLSLLGGLFSRHCGGSFLGSGLLSLGIYGGCLSLLCFRVHNRRNFR